MERRHSAPLGRRAETPICSAGDVTCAAFQVEGAELAEKYLAEAEAQLEPFAERRRRLMACEKPEQQDLVGGEDGGAPGDGVGGEGQRWQR